MKRSITILIAFCIIIISKAQLPVINLTGSNENHNILGENYQELVAHRNFYQSAYMTEDGRTVFQYSKTPINYLTPDNKWERIDISLKKNENGWEIGQQSFPFSIGNNGEIQVFKNNQLLFEYKNETVFGIKNEKTNVSEISATKLEFYYAESIKHTTEARINGVKSDFQIDNLSELNSFSIHQQLNCKNGMKLEPHPILNNGLHLIDVNGEELSVLYPIVCIDAAGNIGRGSYHFEKNSNGYSISIIPDKEWITSSDRIFPVIIDPLITGPTSVWAGGFMPSCDLPNYNADSILVTIPGGVTITGVFVTGSYYADPFSGSIMSNGQMYFSSSCGQTGTLTVGPPNGNLAGTAYLEDVDYRSPLSCCLGPSCADRQFWVRMHLGRNNGGVGCNTTYVYYDPATAWPFSVFVEGRTVETGSVEWNINPGTLCSDECNLTIQAYGRYGVPPYTLYHPWTTDSTVFGNPFFNCSLAFQNSTLQVTRPDCPTYCDTNSTVFVPLPTIKDACGNEFTGFDVKTLTIKPTPQIFAVPDTQTICSGENAHIEFTACPDGTPVFWNTPGFSGTDLMDTIIMNVGIDTLWVNYQATASLNGCNADTLNNIVWVTPNPQADFSFPPVAFVNQDISFSDSSQYYSGSPGTWLWSFGDGGFGTDSSLTHVYTTPGNYQVCMEIINDGGCSDTLCDSIQIIPMQITLPNVVSPNNDGINDILYFEYLEFFGQSHLIVYNRWGFAVYNNENYLNDWIPDNVSDGTYFYVIRLGDGTEYSSTLNVFTDL